MRSVKPERLRTIRGAFPRRRVGLSTLEYLGCFVALAGGVYLGAMYLGIDVKRLAYDALSESRLLDKVPTRFRPESPHNQAMTREQLAATLHAEFGELRNQIASLRSGNPAATTGESEDPAAAAHSLAPTKEQTLAYWASLNEIARNEAALQREAESAFSAANAAKVFAVKGQICRFAARAVEAVPTPRVDEEALDFGRQLGAWYSQGGELYDQAVRIWETSTGPQARTQLNEEWRQADEQHRNEAKLVSQKAAATRSAMSRIYGVGFPEFAAPPNTAEGDQAPPNPPRPTLPKG